MYRSTKKIELGSCAFRQPTAESHCRFIHGYRLTGKFWFEATHLDRNNWVVDFGGLKELKQTLREWYDHTTCISKTDPKLDEFKRLRDAGVCDLRLMDGVGIEKFAEHCFTVANDVVQRITEGRCKCIKVEVFEHEDNSAIFESSDIIVNPQSKIEFQAESTDKPVTKKAQPQINNPAPQKHKTVTSGQTTQTNTWIDKDAPKNSWRF